MNVVLEGLTKSFGGAPVLDGLNLTVRDQEFLSLLGPSGCGKTTTLNIVAGFIEPDGGSVFFDGEPMNDVPANRRGTGMVFQKYALFPHMTVFDNIAYGLKLRKAESSLIKHEVAAALDLVGLPGKEQRYPQQLSGGEQQRVALARALAIKPRVLLFDEPLSNLDAKLRKRMQTELRQVQRAVEITTIYVTHDQEEAFVLSDRVAVMNNGRIEQVGSPVEIYENPRTDFVADFIGEFNVFEGKILSIVESKAMLDVDNTRLLIPVSDTPDAGQRVKIAIRPEKVGLSKEPLIGENVLPGEIISRRFSGALSQFVVTFGGMQIVAQLPNIRLIRSLKVGDQVYVELRPDDWTILSKRHSE